MKIILIIVTLFTYIQLIYNRNLNFTFLLKNNCQLIFLKKYYYLFIFLCNLRFKFFLFVEIDNLPEIQL